MNFFSVRMPHRTFFFILFSFLFTSSISFAGKKVKNGSFSHSNQSLEGSSSVVDGTTTQETVVAPYEGQLQVKKNRKSRTYTPEVITPQNLFVQKQKNVNWATIKSQNPESAIPVFKELAEKKALQNLNIGVAPESFEFTWIVTEEAARNGGVKYMMGEGGPSENIHEETLTEAFQMQLTQVTQFQVVLQGGNNRSHFSYYEDSIYSGVTLKVGEIKVNLRPNNPAENYSFDEIQTMMELLNERDPKWNYRLATPAEWEYAARGGTRSLAHYGPDPYFARDYGWANPYSKISTQRVASLLPNSFGLYDMYGNVWEWVQDKTLRGGSCMNFSERLNSVESIRVEEGSGHPNFGWRYVRTLKPNAQE